ncbi:hypothetical protein ALC60_00478 [Trachymyrmex zeteki]|uniref:Secapin n=1 Tax=Mycetomoellerius zeteki TaxID=64791 RepID=A0A151XJM0_9HYME|nr:PREDICTED: uncharacterized protein LOC108721630 [Trachymyrmex zeteki]KYQ60495.1 hypothetical protein ALC60_00478 [Trachymyrmex zeteki]
MRFYFPQRFLSVLLLLVALTCATQASSLRARRSVWNDIGNTLNNIGQTIKGTMKTGIDSLFLHQHSTADPETIQPTLEPNWNETTLLKRNESNFREIIDAPVRCPPNHVLVRNKCRIHGRR